eukprot:6785261-Prymnesium_polylepis.1
MGRGGRASAGRPNERAVLVHGLEHACTSLLDRPAFALAVATHDVVVHLPPGGSAKHGFQGRRGERCCARERRLGRLAGSARRRGHTRPPRRLAWFSSLSALSRLTMSYSDIHLPSANGRCAHADAWHNGRARILSRGARESGYSRGSSELQMEVTTSSTVDSRPPKLLDESKRRFCWGLGFSNLTAVLTCSRALATISSHV